VPIKFKKKNKKKKKKKCVVFGRTFRAFWRCKIRKNIEKKDKKIKMRKIREKKNIWKEFLVRTALSIKFGQKIIKGKRVMIFLLLLQKRFLCGDQGAEKNIFFYFILFFFVLSYFFLFKLVLAYINCLKSFLFFHFWIFLSFFSMFFLILHLQNALNVRPKTTHFFFFFFLFLFCKVSQEWCVILLGVVDVHQP